HREENRCQDGDNGYHHEQLDQCECEQSPSVHLTFSLYAWPGFALAVRTQNGACSLARANSGRRAAARTAMMAITTSSSISVNASEQSPRRLIAQLASKGATDWQPLVGDSIRDWRQNSSCFSGAAHLDQARCCFRNAMTRSNASITTGVSMRPSK